MTAVQQPPTTGFPDSLLLTSRQWEQMRAEVDDRAPEEACGLLAGQGNRVLSVLPVPNELHSAVRYRMNPRDQWQAFQEIENQGWDLLGIYHSHPLGPDHPSAADIAEAYYPESVYLIWSRRTGVWQCRGYRIQSSQVQKITLWVAGSEQPF